MPVPRTLYILADGGRARYIERIGPGRFSTFRDLACAHRHDTSPELTRGRPGRVRESATNATAFLRSIAEDLVAHKRIGDFDNLVLAAPARLQNILLDALTPALTDKLASCINKNLTKVPDSDLYSHLPVFLAPNRTPNPGAPHVA
ncbi:host attachment protein [Nordella sp. HKS 07]|uniref:host attachment protein n=1 Tax=Nordella sp. HKS 07 TaxID=2712222 RepID=UPI0013E1CE35|nr:host attachment protein [Nordella sp. HKS 07]QIG48899.1 host attachment protein [Nordella sp. HKS 07]